jgi:protein SCO1/2
MRQLKPTSIAVSAALLFACLALPLQADLARPPQMEGVGIDEKIGQPVDLDLTFIAENGYPVALRSFFHKDRPVILNLVYYSCPMLCNLVLNGQVSSLREMPWTPGDQYEVVTISIDPTETFNLAQQKKQVYLASYDRPAPGWHFLVDHEGHAKQLAEQIGFHYKYDDKQQQYAHAAAIMVLTPEGKMARYLYGIKFKQRDLRLTLTEAAAGRGSLSIDKVLLLCFHYDPQTRSYVLFATNLMRVGAALSALMLGLVLVRFWRKEQPQ